MTLYYKFREVSLKNARVILLQNATKVVYKNASGFFITKCDSYYHGSTCYYKMRCLLQNTSAQHSVKD